MDSADSIPDAAWSLLDSLAAIPLWQWTLAAVLSIFGVFALLYVAFALFAPLPRPPRTSEKQFVTVLPDGKVSTPEPLPCWYDHFTAARETARRGSGGGKEAYRIDEGEVFMSVVVPAYNEEKRLTGMLEEAVEYLQKQYGTRSPAGKGTGNGHVRAHERPRAGWEILVVSDGSTDRTVETALHFAKTQSIPTGSIRVVRLEENRGKGGAVTHGMRHARGSYVVFADADGASNFDDLGKLVKACEDAEDKQGRAIGIGSRAHMVGSDAVIKRSLLRNTLMRAFHLLIRTLTTTETGQIKDTQCGFKLFTRPALPYIVPYMHSEGWIFDVEMLMLAESSHIPMVEVAIGWHEVSGSKLNVIKDSIGMAIGLAMLRVGWGLGIYRLD
ncbi:nucleotide-diphospho-sugar transferase [Neohortaea acidophila]|uniref:dolichyl-phosphate beta-glucosyltransferase n=1 Tax=Neohortaea acidophila TaxID=245834 RepID=A0A6A6PNU4_9PEZI|nr:nucleotide-diphospho-sugar transferase [Neohortaea acidophila]KAF2481682.1 nucleotide-diphospho-sugar transferase [Neohortaea acidophila]